MFTLRLRLGYLMRETSPSTAIGLFQEVLQIDPQRLGVNTLIAETYVIEAQQATDPPTQQQAYANAIAAYQAELALSPVTPQSTALDCRHGEQFQGALGVGTGLCGDGTEQSGKKRVAIVFAGDEVAQ